MTLGIANKRSPFRLLLLKKKKRLYVFEVVFILRLVKGKESSASYFRPKAFYQQL